MTWGYVRKSPRLIVFLKYAIILTILIAAGIKANAATITVPAGGSLQSAINSALPGDTIIVEAGVVYTGDFVLPIKSGTGYITIQSSRAHELPEGVRVGSAQSALLARIRSKTTASPVLRRSEEHTSELQSPC